MKKNKGTLRTAIALGTALLLCAGSVAAYASDVDASVVDATAPTDSVTLAPGGGPASITINLRVTGKQDGTATFKVDRDWTLNADAHLHRHQFDDHDGSRAASSERPRHDVQ